ncbi:hypothetical protein [Mesorhizobium sp. B1-1-6]|uniref:hypothetical protein n=1 Tax=Mesorhizobium sp. B1-1-6 TaxID=2589978 RepID=UPI001FED79C0|nr:hypothetical protein [Mesorhizobium sp. B1-1-6]
MRSTSDTSAAIGLAGTFVASAPLRGRLEANVPCYLGAILLWAAALVMVSKPSSFALWMRLISA